MTICDPCCALGECPEFTDPFEATSTQILCSIYNLLTGKQGSYYPSEFVVDKVFTAEVGSTSTTLNVREIDTFALVGQRILFEGNCELVTITTVNVDSIVVTPAILNNVGEGFKFFLLNPASSAFPIRIPVDAYQAGTWTISVGPITIGTVDQGAAGLDPWLITGTVAATQSGVWTVTTTFPTSMDVNVDEWGGVATTLGQKVMASSVPVVLSSDQSTIPISAASLPLPAGAATSALQTSQLTQLQILTPVVNEDGVAAGIKLNLVGGIDNVTGEAFALRVDAGRLFVVGSVPIDDISNRNPVTIGARAFTALPPTVSADGDVQEIWITRFGALKTCLVDDAGDSVMDGANDAVRVNVVAGGTGGGGNVNVDQWGGVATTLGQKVMASSVPVVIASDQSPIPVTGSFSGTSDVNVIQWGGAATTLGQKAMTASVPVVLASDQSAIPVSQSGTWNINNISGVISLPTGAATAANQATEIASLSVLDDWDETDRAKVNIIVGQAGITAAAGTVAANTPRVTLASNDPAVVALQAIGHPTTPTSGRRVVAVAGTALALIGSSAPCKKVDVTAELDNTGVIVIGASTVIATLATRTGTPLSAGDYISIEITDANILFINSTVTGDGVTYTYYN